MMWERGVVTGNDEMPMKDDVGMIMRVRMNMIIAKTCTWSSMLSSIYRASAKSSTKRGGHSIGVSSTAQAIE